MLIREISSQNEIVEDLDVQMFAVDQALERMIFPSFVKQSRLDSDSEHSAVTLDKQWNIDAIDRRYALTAESVQFQHAL
jgi:hypothetical protein